MNFNDFYDYVRPHVPLIPQPSVARIAKLVARQFFAETFAWRYSETFNLTANTVNQTLPFTGLDQNLSVERVWLVQRTADWMDLIVTTPELLARRWQNWRTATGQPEYFIRGMTSDFRVAPKPDSTYEVMVELAVAPSLLSATLPDNVFAAYGDTLVSGVLADVFGSEDENWFNPQRAVQHQTDYMDGVSAASRRAKGEESYKSSTVEYGGY